ncbi:PGF-pre-PGF domain-containing protein [Candidatus Woesearchaeota archaeon]|nr:PGF-pre-PGF domain-containing protein [Candidatus Woesearchaeota archaeon]
MESSNGNRKNGVGIALTLFVIVALLLSGPASAVTLTIHQPSSFTPDEQSTVSFRISVDVENTERIPIQNLTIYINSQQCTFNVEAEEISGDLCGSISIAKYSSSIPEGYGYGLLYGYGWDPDSQYQNITFGSGYGYNNSATYELDYYVVWNTPDVTEDTPITVRLDAHAGSGSTTHTYSTTQSSFFTVKPKFYRRSSGWTGPIPVSDPESTHVWNKVPTEDSNMMIIDDEEIDLTQIKFSVKTDLQDVEVTVTRLLENPYFSSQLGEVYQVFEISKKNMVPEDIHTAEMRFRVKNTWLNQNNINPSQVALYRFNDGWVRLPTSYLNTDSKYTYYQAKAPSFSTFAIASETAPVLIPQIQGGVTEEPTLISREEQSIETDKPAADAVKVSINIMIFALIGIFAVVAIIIFFAMQRMTKKHSLRAKEYVEQQQKAATQPNRQSVQQSTPNTLEDKFVPLMNYLKACKNAKYPLDYVRKSLLDIGWDKRVVEHFLGQYY